ncbi:MAG: hypothetical protein F4W99_11595 [Chloroflexi bacterium]|nr:hypothetical protein [Chloroflexota bacterium]MYJ02017.1 hypothetical protein [Chloroflexota bacterium]
MTITTAQVEAALIECEPKAEYRVNGLALFTERANGELSAWGHASHDVSLERVIPFYGDPRVLRLAFWCETCHVSQLALLARPDVE